MHRSVSLARKLQIPSGQKVCVLNTPPSFQLDVPSSDEPKQTAIILFARDSNALKTQGKLAFDAARADRIAWIAYPKAAQLDTDLNRDVLWKLVKPYGIRPVRQISVDDVWSALRFRPA